MTEPMGTWPETIPAAARIAAERWPKRVGLIEGEDRRTFAQLWGDARKCASAMLAHGIGHGDRVAIWAPNGGGWIIAALGAQIAGAAIVPMNTRFKGQEAADILRRSHAKLLFTPREFLGTDYQALLVGEELPDLQALVHIDEGFDAFIARGNGPNDSAVDNALARLSGDDVSDIIFTSGTTGRPKGAITTHRQVVQTFGDWSVRVDLREGDNHLIVNPFFHAFGYKAGWVACLIQGATIIPMAVFDAAEIMRQIELNRVNFLPGPPTIYLSLLHELATNRSHDFSSMRGAPTDRKKDIFISGGFNCYPAEIEKLLMGHPAIESAAVIGIADERMGEVGKAYIVLRPGSQADEASIIGWARDAMANYKVPRKVALVKELPRNAGGKVLRTKLLELEAMTQEN